MAVDWTDEGSGQYGMNADTPVPRMQRGVIHDKVVRANREPNLGLEESGCDAVEIP
jgi:hypothetical protein